MISFYDQVPSVYVSASRDFQYLSWLINIVLNSVKHNVDGLYNLPNTGADPRLTELLATTLGFKVKRKYDQKQLATIVSIIPRILKYKGTIEAVMLVGKALITTSGAAGTFKCNLENNCLKITLPEELVDTILFMDLLPYILPAGLTCQVVRNTQIEAGLTPITLEYSEVMHAEWRKDLDWDENTQTATGLAGLFEPGGAPIFANFKNTANQYELNAGLLDNSIIPALGSTVQVTEPDFTETPNAYGTTVTINRYTSENNDHDGKTVIQ